jgi:RNA polymerase sigma-70 factor (ECF subfamily)
MLDGDERAFDEFFDIYFDRVFRFALRRTCDEDAAEEVAQATLVRAMGKLGTWRGEASLFTWLCAICRREQMAYWTRRNTTTRGDGPADTLDRLPSPTDGPEQAMQREETSGSCTQRSTSCPIATATCSSGSIEGRRCRIALRLGSTPKAVSRC